MKRRVRWFLRIVGCLAALAVLGVGAAFVALRHVPAFYDKAMNQSATDLRKGSDQFLRQLTALHSAAHRPGRWKVRITAEQINGWLAVDLVENHPHVLAPGVSDTRVAIRPDGMKLACRTESGAVRCILSLAIRPYVPQTDMLALRLIGARAGALPLPLGRVLESLSEAAHAMHLPLKWRQADGDPVAMIGLAGGDGDPALRIDAIELGDGWVDLSGTAGEANARPDGNGGSCTGILPLCQTQAGSLCYATGNHPG